jgi:hypothetical protein
MSVVSALTNRSCGRVDGCVKMVDIPDGLSAQLILDLQIRLLTKQKRDALTAEISHLRELVLDPSSDPDGVLI